MKQHVDAVHAFINSNVDVFLLVFRLIVGLFFFYHGATKFGLIGDGSIQAFAQMASLPLWLAVLAAFIELVGGLFIAAGFYTRYAAFSSAIVMLVAYILAHAPKGFLPTANGGEMALLYLAVFIVLIGIGAGKMSVDALIGEQ